MNLDLASALAREPLEREALSGRRIVMGAFIRTCSHVSASCPYTFAYEHNPERNPV
jgi:hypothetical protein